MAWRMRRSGREKWWVRGAFTIQKVRHIKKGYSYQLTMALRRGSGKMVIGMALGMYKGSPKGFKAAKMRAKMVHSAMKRSVHTYIGRKKHAKVRKGQGNTKGQGRTGKGRKTGKQVR